MFQSLTLLISVLPKTFIARRSLSAAPRLTVALSELQDKFDLIGLTIGSIETYNTVVQKAMVDSIDKGIVPENIPKTCFEGGVAHSEQLDIRLEFIEFIIYS